MSKVENPVKSEDVINEVPTQVMSKVKNPVNLIGSIEFDKDLLKQSIYLTSEEIINEIKKILNDFVFKQFDEEKYPITILTSYESLINLKKQRTDLMISLFEQIKEFLYNLLHNNELSIYLKKSIIYLDEDSIKLTQIYDILITDIYNTIIEKLSILYNRYIRLKKNLNKQNSLYIKEYICDPLFFLFAEFELSEKLHQLNVIFCQNFTENINEAQDKIHYISFVSNKFYSVKITKNFQEIIKKFQAQENHYIKSALESIKNNLDGRINELKRFYNDPGEILKNVNKLKKTTRITKKESYPFVKSQNNREKYQSTTTEQVEQKEKKRRKLQHPRKLKLLQPLYVIMEHKEEDDDQ